jgi:hypothetical protein
MTEEVKESGIALRTMRAAIRGFRMRSRTTAGLLIIIFFVAWTPVAEGHHGGEHATPFLVPVYPQRLPGAFGSIWSSQWRVLNSSDAEVTLFPLICDPGCGPLATIRAGEEFVGLTGGGFPNGFWFGAFPSDADGLTFQLRVFDESRSDLNWGTHVPVVDWEAEKGRLFWFVAVPATERFRHTVRVYSASHTSVPAVVRFYLPDGPAGGNRLLTERSVVVHSDAPAQFDSLGIPELSGIDEVRIQVEVAPSAGDRHVWAMVSVTNVETQVVTIIPGRTVRTLP